MGPEIEEGFWDYLWTIDGSKLKVTGIKEGTLVFGKEPLLTLEGPIGIV